jgi:hypothetical protein
MRELMYALVFVVVQDNSTAAIEQRQAITEMALNVVLSLSTGPGASTSPASLAQSAMMVSSIVGAGTMKI